MEIEAGQTGQSKEGHSNTCETQGYKSINMIISPQGKSWWWPV